MSRARLLLLLEFVLLFGSAPFIILCFKNHLVMAGLLWICAFAAYGFMRLHHDYHYGTDWNWKGFRQHVRHVLLRFCVLGPLLVLLAWVMQRHGFMSLPLQRPQLWLFIMILYPLLSVWPQEILYRSYIYHRFAALFGHGKRFVAASALAFATVHLIFLNWPAVLLTLAGGGIFARTYQTSRSLALVCFEHALYGCLIFTVGLGLYFYSGAAWHTRY